MIPAGAKLVLPMGKIPQLKPVNTERPRMPPPQTPNGELTVAEFNFNLIHISHHRTDKISNGQSSESINSFTEGQNASKQQPSTVAAARKVRISSNHELSYYINQIGFSPTRQFQSFNDSISGSTTFGKYGKYGESLDSSCSTLDISANDNSNRSFLSDERSPGSSPGVTVQPINYVSIKVNLDIRSFH